jgi:Ran GTPase-activating protein (RanGAP) involved in mRNA processing and transport
MIDHRNPSLEDLIQKSPKHLVLDLVGKNLVDVDMEIVVAQGILNRKCTGLRLGFNHFTSEGASVLARALVNNETVEHLNLWKNDLSDGGVQHLTESISLSKNRIRTLDLSQNGITDRGVKYLARMLKNNQLLTNLLLAGNDITYEGIKLLAQILCRGNDTLQVLSLSRNALLDDASIDPLMDIIQNNRSLTKLWLDDCNLSKNGQKKLQTAAARRKNMKLYL